MSFEPLIIMITIVENKNKCHISTKSTVTNKGAVRFLKSKINYTAIKGLES